MRKLLALAAEHMREIVGLSGLGATVYGVAQVYQPAAWIVGGIALAAGAVLTPSEPVPPAPAPPQPDDEG
jgi:hypothetical protein